MIDPNDLRSDFQAAAAELHDELDLIGVTYDGLEPNLGWVAVAGENGDPSVGWEGLGDSPLEALSDLVARFQAKPAGAARSHGGHAMSASRIRRHG